MIIERRERCRPGRVPSWTVALLWAVSGVAVAVVPVEGRGIVERPISGGYDGQPGVVTGGFFEAHPGGDGRLWILDRQTGRVRSCAPADDADRAPRCSPWSE